MTSSDHARPRGCCDACEGTGRVNDPDTNGQCWDCRGTGHCHAPDPTCPGWGS